MPNGPRGEKRPPDVIENAVHVAQIATGEAREIYAQKPPRKGSDESRSRAGGTRTRNHTVRKSAALSVELQPHRGG